MRLVLLDDVWDLQMKLITELMRVRVTLLNFREAGCKLHTTNDPVDADLACLEY